MARVSRRRTGDIEVRLDANEIDVLRHLLVELVEVVGGPPDDPVVARLFPDGYRDDPVAAAELRALTEDDLRAAKLDAARTVAGSLAERVVLDGETAGVWLAALNDVRLALGTRLGVTEDTYDALGELVPDDPLYLYDWLTWLQERLVNAVAGP